MRVGRRCFTSNLSWRTSWQDLKDAFRPCGNVVYCNIIKDSQGKYMIYSSYRLEDGPRGLFGRLVWAPCGVMAFYSFDLLSSPSSFFSCAGRSKGWGIVEFETPEEVGFVGIAGFWLAASIFRPLQSDIAVTEQPLC